MPHYVAEALADQAQGREAIDIVGESGIGGATGMRRRTIKIDFRDLNAGRAVPLVANDTLEVLKLGDGDVIHAALVVTDRAAGAAATCDLEIDFAGTVVTTKTLINDHNMNEVADTTSATGQTKGSSSTAPASPPPPNLRRSAGKRPNWPPPPSSAPAPASTPTGGA